jgi:hypothetical protein
MAKTKKKPMSPVERAIWLHTRGIEAAKHEIAHIQECADEAIAKVKKSINKRQILMDALKSGSLKP